MINELETVLFHRSYRCLRGGHLKVYDYYDHVKHSPYYRPEIYFSRVVWDPNNPRWSEKETVLTRWDPSRAQVLFLAGMDWQLLDEAQRKSAPWPIINLIQSFRHSLPYDKRYAFLPYKTIRICVSPEVEAAIRDTGRANGPIHTISSAISVIKIPRDSKERNISVLIFGLKEPKIAEKIAIQLERRIFSAKRIEVISSPIPRERFLAKMIQAETTVFLPKKREGFYLPALEGMFMGTLVVCPDCIGNRSFCIDRLNCVMPQYSVANITDSVISVLNMQERDRAELTMRALDTAHQHSLESERTAFFEILHNLSQIW